jgi:acetylornithine deacetylase
MTAWESGRAPATFRRWDARRRSCRRRAPALEVLDQGRMVGRPRGARARAERHGGRARGRRAPLDLGREHGLEGAVVEHDLAALRAAPGHPGEEAARAELVHAEVTLRGTRPRRAAAVSQRPPRRRAGGRGGLDRGPGRARSSTASCTAGAPRTMNGGVVALLPRDGCGAGRGLRVPGDVVLQGSRRRRTGGSGRSRRSSATRVRGLPDPRADGLRARLRAGGALTFGGTVSGRAAHAAVRSTGSRRSTATCRSTRRCRRTSAREHRRRRTLMREHALPYPLLVGQLRAGGGRARCPTRCASRAHGRARSAATCARRAARCRPRSTRRRARRTPCSSPGPAGSSRRPRPTRPPVGRARPGRARATSSARRRRSRGDLGRGHALFCAKGIPCVMLGTHGLQRAHGSTSASGLGGGAARACHGARDRALWRLAPPCRVSTSDRGPPRSRCSQRQMPCQVPRRGRAVADGSVRTHHSDDFTWAACRRWPSSCAPQRLLARRRRRASAPRSRAHLGEAYLRDVRPAEVCEKTCRGTRA